MRAAEQLRSEVATLVFTPDRLAIVKGGPAVRRAYFDRALGRLSPARAQLATEYAAAVAQRNASLRRMLSIIALAASVLGGADATPTAAAAAPIEFLVARNPSQATRAP